VSTLKAEQSDILSQQDALKKILYSKFGDNINLEEHDSL
jgi:chaperonin cofactor prefoldin